MEVQEPFGVPEQALSAKGSKVFSLPSRVFCSSESLSLWGERIGEGAPMHRLSEANGLGDGQTCESGWEWYKKIKLCFYKILFLFQKCLFFNYLIS